MSYGALPGNLSDCAVANLRAGRTAAGIVTGVCTPGDLRVGNAAVVVVDQIVDVAGVGRHDEAITHIRGDDRAADDAEGRRLHPVSTIEDRSRVRMIAPVVVMPVLPFPRTRVSRITPPNV